MRCPKCRKELGDGMLPACCPHCGANLAAGVDTRRSAREARRVASSYAAQQPDIPRRSGGGNIARAFVAILLVGIAAALVSFVLYENEMWGGRSIPDVVGMRVERATEELAASGFTTTVETRKDDGQPGLVLEQSPAPGDRMAEGTQIKLFVSEQRTMPDVVGKTREEAQALMDAEGIPCEFVDEVSDEAAGTVLSSTSPAGTALSSEALVTLHVAAPRTVPEVVGLDESMARTKLTDIGLEVKVTYVEVSDTSTDGKVTAVNPAPGTAVHKGDTVEITVNRARIERLKKAAEGILNAVYDCADPSSADSPIGAALRSYVDPNMRVSGETTANAATNYQLWYGIAKHWQKTPEGVPEGMAALPRTLLQIDGIEATADGHVVAAVTVRWDWSPLGGDYAGVTSTDTHYVSMDFNDQDLLTAYWDEQTDMPYYEIQATPENKDAENKDDNG